MENSCNIDCWRLDRLLYGASALHFLCFRLGFLENFAGFISVKMHLPDSLFWAALIWLVAMLGMFETVDHVQLGCLPQSEAASYGYFAQCIMAGRILFLPYENTVLCLHVKISCTFHVFWFNTAYAPMGPEWLGIPCNFH